MTGLNNPEPLHITHMETLKAIKTVSKGKRRTELIGLVSETITHDDIFWHH